MTVSMHVARQITNIQMNAWASSSTLDYPEHYVLFEGLFVGFNGKTRMKLKRFRSIQHMFAYLNKLHVGGWMNDDDYKHAWQVLKNLSEFVNVDIFSS